MKKLLFLFALVLFCACEEDMSVDPTLMPQATSVGENTLGCLIDGWVYACGRYGKPTASVSDDEDNHYVVINAEVALFRVLRFVLVNPRQGATCTYTNASFDRETLEDGEAYITYMNGTVISGTFSGGSITEGRFDIKYQNTPDDGGTVIY